MCSRSAGATSSTSSRRRSATSVPRRRPRPTLEVETGAPPTSAQPVEAIPDDELVREVEDALAGVVAEPEAPEAPAPVKPSFRDRLSKARSLFSGYVGSVLSRSSIDDETWDDLEEALIRADVGVSTTTALLDQLRATVEEEGITEPEALLDVAQGRAQGRLWPRAIARCAIEPGDQRVAVRRRQRRGQDHHHRQGRQRQRADAATAS